MLKKCINADDVCNLLNEALNMDPNCINELASYRVQCNDKMANHPTIQVRQYIDDKHPKLGLIGLINGMFGIRRDGMGAICVDVELNGKILKFKPTPQYQHHNKQIRVKNMLYWMSNNNFGYYTNRFIEEGVREFKPIMFIRKLQCDIFGHDWFCWTNGWCAWCARKTGKYPKMRVRQPENMKSLQATVPIACNVDELLDKHFAKTKTNFKTIKLTQRGKT